jgi:NitT/TauT family transport system ATP-binding protein
MWFRRGKTQKEEAPAPAKAPSLLHPARVLGRNAKIAAANVDHRYANEVQALKGVSLNVRRGEFACLLGPSGCGKSTLLQMLAGHIRPTDGHVCIDGDPISGPSPDRLMMFQDPALYPWRTVEGNITFALAARGVSKRERVERARKFIHQVQLDGFENALPHELSGGMKMRASLARALAMSPAVLLMDEPFGSLDAHTRTRMHALLANLWEMLSTTIVFVTHDVREAVVLADRIVLMAPRPGRVVRDLDLRLPRPRDPEDPRVNIVAKELREILDQSDPAETEALPSAPKERETHAVENRSEPAQLRSGLGVHLGPGL